MPPLHPPRFYLNDGSGQFIQSDALISALLPGAYSFAGLFVTLTPGETPWLYMVNDFGPEFVGINSFGPQPTVLI